MHVKKSIKHFFRPQNLWPRKLVQAFFFVFIALIAINHQLAESGGGIPFLTNASRHAICPFGGVVVYTSFQPLAPSLKKSINLPLC